MKFRQCVSVFFLSCHCLRRLDRTVNRTIFFFSFWFTSFNYSNCFFLFLLRSCFTSTFIIYSFLLWWSQCVRFGFPTIKNTLQNKLNYISPVERVCLINSQEEKRQQNEFEYHRAQLHWEIWVFFSCVHIWVWVWVEYADAQIEINA